MSKEQRFPDYIFESSWEVCNKIGGIYAVLSTRAKTLQALLGDKLIFIGPDCWKNTESPFFKEDETIYADWLAQTKCEKLSVRIGRWNIPGRPVAVLVDFTPFYQQKDEIYSQMWEDFQVDSLHAYGDYDEASMFSYAAAKVVESFYHFYLNEQSQVIYHGNEWMTSLGLLYVQKCLPQVGTVFTTHATSIGRSIAGNNKPLYEYLSAYHGDQMAAELNMQSKHSVEKQAALNVDCFTTVSDITAAECRELLDKPVDCVLPNGFEDNFVPKGAAFTKKRKEVRIKMLNIANALLGTDLGDDTLIVATSGRYEFRNKGIDVFIEAMNRLRFDAELQKNVVAFIEVPGWVGDARQDLQERLASGKKYDTPLPDSMLTHWLHNPLEDRVLGMARYSDFQNRAEDKVKLIFIPCYLNGDDGIVDMPYYDVVSGNDLSVFPSYYEPWGYTPLESIAFKVPCITTDLAGFGLWANAEKGKSCKLIDGVEVVHRTDYNYSEVADEIKNAIVAYASLDDVAVKKARDNASKLSKQALWDKFIAYYKVAYDIALSKAVSRKNQ